MRALIIKMPSLCEELCYSSASLVDEASEARRHNKDAFASRRTLLCQRVFIRQGK